MAPTVRVSPQAAIASASVVTRSSEGLMCRCGRHSPNSPRHLCWPGGLGSGTRTTLDLALQEYTRAVPLLELGSTAAIRTSVLGGVDPAVLSTLAVADQVRSGDMRVIDVDGLDLDRSLRAVWRPPRQLAGAAGELVRLARRDGQENAATGVVHAR